MGKSRIMVRGTILGLVLVPLAAFVFMQVWNANSPYCNGEGGGKDRMACALMLVWVPVFTILPGGIAGLFLGWLIGASRRPR
jgi:hypothetical protein